MEPFTREINDPELIQYIILYAMAEADRRLSHSELTEFVLDCVNILYTNFCIGLDNLVVTDHINKYSSDKNSVFYELSEKGVMANGFFKRDIPHTIRMRISDYKAPFFREQELKNSIKAELTPINEREFMATCCIYENRAPLMELNLFCGTREMANAVVKYFRENTQEVFTKITEVMTPPRE